MRIFAIAALTAAMLAAAGADAAEKHAVYDRTRVSAGSMAARATAVVTARSVLRVQGEDSAAFTLTVSSVLAGDAPSEVIVVLHAAAALCQGEHVAFLLRSAEGSWSLLGGADFGWICISEVSRDLLFRTVRAHARGEIEEMAAAASDALLGDDPRLAGDAAVDAFNRPEIVGLLDTEAKKAVARLVGTPAGRAFIPGEWHYLAVAAGRIGDQASVSSLISAASDPACLSRAFAIGKAFSFVGEHGRVALLHAFENAKDESAIPGLIAACAEIKLAAALPGILATADSGSAAARKFAIVAAGDIGGPSAIAFLKNALMDERRPDVERKLAVVALAANTDPDGIRAIVKADSELPQGDLLRFVRAFRKDPASQRLQLLRTALHGD